MGNAVSVPVINSVISDLIENNQHIFSEYANAKRHTHLQSRHPSSTQTVKEYASANAS
jgi:hypothetical protein